MYTVTGKVKHVSDTLQVSEKFAKREIVITTDGQYPQDIQVIFKQDKCKLLDAVFEGTNATVHFNLRGKEYNGKYYNELDGWKVDA